MICFRNIGYKPATVAAIGLVGNRDQAYVEFHNDSGEVIDCTYVSRRKTGLSRHDFYDFFAVGAVVPLMAREVIQP